MSRLRWLIPSLLTFTACAPDSATGPLGTAASLAPSQAVGTPLTFDDRMLAVERDAPGFAGAYIEAGLLVIRLTPSADAPAVVERLLSERIGPPSRSFSSSHTTKHADYTFRELADWRRRLQRTLDRRLVKWIDVDEFENRIVIAGDSQQLTALEQAAAGAAIPKAAWRVIAAPDIVAGTAAQSVTLQDYVRPLRGGLKIHVPNTAICTHGPMAHYYDQLAFLINSHCTTSLFNHDGSFVYQPFYSPGEWIGLEVSDPPAPYYGCPTGLSPCRYSDAAVIQYRSTASVNFYEVATTSAPYSIQITGSAWPLYYTSGFPGAPVTKTGMVSGTSSGVVTRSCVDLSYSGTYWLLCQTEATGTTTGGDSGAPVFDPTAAEYTLAWGLNWSAGFFDSGTGQYKYTFSENANMTIDHGPGLSLCIPCY